MQIVGNTVPALSFFECISWKVSFRNRSNKNNFSTVPVPIQKYRYFLQRENLFLGTFKMGQKVKGTKH